MGSNEEKSQTWTTHQKRLLEYQIWHSCLNCEDWHEEKNVCVRFEVTPPPATIVHGCVYWLASIPF